MLIKADLSSSKLGSDYGSLACAQVPSIDIECQDLSYRINTVVLGEVFLLQVLASSLVPIPTIEDFALVITIGT